LKEGAKCSRCPKFAFAKAAVDNHILELGSAIGFFDDIGNNRVRDVFGVVWDRSVDKDIGNVEGYVLPEPTLAGYTFPDPLDKRFFQDIPTKIAKQPDRFRVFYLGFSLFERAWTIRGMENLMIDFIDSPAFVHELFTAIADYDIAQVREAPPSAGAGARRRLHLRALPRSRERRAAHQHPGLP
jgi:uroporphyrinogen decarboxylase